MAKSTAILDIHLRTAAMMQALRTGEEIGVFENNLLIFLSALCGIAVQLPKGDSHTLRIRVDFVEMPSYGEDL